MKRWVDFRVSDTGIVTRGFEGARFPTPVDRAAELVLTAAKHHAVLAIDVHFGEKPNATEEERLDKPETIDTWTVVATSETHVGGTGTAVRIDRQ